MLTKLVLEGGIKHDICHAVEDFYIEFTTKCTKVLYKGHKAKFQVKDTTDNKLSYYEHKAI